MKVNKVLLSLVIIALMTSCNNQTGSSDDKTVEGKEEVTLGEEVSVQEAPDNEAMDRGRKVYDRVCLVCHQSDGSGVPMMYPPVIESDYISGNTDSLIVLILEGMSGPVMIKGEEYNSIMPPQKNILSDDEVADLINYLRN